MKEIAHAWNDERELLVLGEVSLRTPKYLNPQRLYTHRAGARSQDKKSPQPRSLRSAGSSGSGIAVAMDEGSPVPLHGGQQPQQAPLGGGIFSTTPATPATAVGGAGIGVEGAAAGGGVPAVNEAAAAFRDAWLKGKEQEAARERKRR